MLLTPLDRPGPVLSRLDWPLADIIAGQGVTVPVGVEFGEAPLPADAEGIAAKDWGPVLSVLTDPSRVAAGAMDVSVIVLAPSLYLTNRAHQPLPRVLHEVTATVAAAHGSRAERRVLVEPGSQLQAPMTAGLDQGKGIVIESRFED